MLFDKIVFPSWLSPNGAGVDQEPYETYSGIPIPINIQPESPMVSSLGDGEMFSTFHFFTLYSGLQNGWRLTVSGSNPAMTYIVKGVNRMNYGAGQHYEGTLTRDKQ